MRCRCLMLLGALAAVVAGASVPLAGQAPQAAGSAAAPTTSWTPARTAWGDPDLRGIWRNLVQNTPFERPKELGEKAFYTDAEVAAKVRAAEEERAARQTSRFARGLIGNVRGFPAGADAPRPVSDEPIQISPQTSAIIDPPNARLPPWTPAQVT